MKASAQARDRWRLATAIPSVSTADSDHAGVSGTHAIDFGLAVDGGRLLAHGSAAPGSDGERTKQLELGLSRAQAELLELRLERDELARRLDAALAEIARLQGALPSSPAVTPELAAPSPELSDSTRSELSLTRIVVTSSSMSHELDVELLDDSHLVVGLEQDIAQGGWFVASYRALPIGTRVSLMLEYGEGSVLVHGEVRWLRDAREDLQQRPGFCVAFGEISPDAVAALVELCRARPARYYEL